MLYVEIFNSFSLRESFFCFQQSPGQYNHLVDEKEFTVDQWKELIYHEVIQYELDQIKKHSNVDQQNNNDQSLDQAME